jgi:very-short-patch-repair endonuclease
MWCPYCVNQKLCENKCCKICFDKSFASHEKSKYWSSKNSITPRQITKSSGTKGWFNCDKCSHEFEKDPHNISGKNSWCPYCANKKMCFEENCHDCFQKSFASHEKVKFWSKRNQENPRHIFKGNSERYWFNCEKCELEFDSILYNINSGYWCPFCVNLTETKLYKTLRESYPSIIHQFKQDWCKRTLYLPFDFCIPEYNIIIEMDGPQHFVQIMDWKSPQIQFEMDKYKETCANENNYSVIRIVQKDVWDNTYDWCKELSDAIEEIKHGDNIMNIYLCKNREYINF